MTTITLNRSLPTITLETSPLAGIFFMFRLWHTRAVQRRQLAELEEWRRQDVGLSADQIKKEVAKPFWQA